MSGNRTLAIEIEGKMQAITLSEGEWLSIKNGDNIEKQLPVEEDGETFNYVFKFNPPNYKASSLIIEYDDGGVCFVGTLADAHIYSFMDLN